MKRFRWAPHIDEMRAMLASGKTGADVARHFGLELSACYKGLKRYGLELDPEATLKARTAACVTMATRPDIRAKRARIQKAKMADPVRREKYRQIMLARHAADPTLKLRMVEASRAPDTNAKRSRKARERWAKVQSWLPEPFRQQYRHLIKSKNFRAAEARAMLEPEIKRWLASFEGQMWKLSTGQARLVPNVKVSAVPSAYAGSLTGSGLAGISK